MHRCTVFNKLREKTKRLCARLSTWHGISILMREVQNFQEFSNVITFFVRPFCTFLKRIF